MIVVKFWYTKGVYMLVSAISANKDTTLLTRINSRGGENNTSETALTFLNSASQHTDAKLNQVYDAINLWKNFCHRQIEQGKFDIIA